MGSQPRALTGLKKMFHPICQILSYVLQEYTKLIEEKQFGENDESFGENDESVALKQDLI